MNDDILDLAITFEGGMRVAASFSGYKVLTDQPVDVGGGGTSPAPFELFLASIGTCAGIYVLRFLQTHGLSDEGVSLRQRVIWDGGRVARIELEIHVPPGFPEKYLKMLERTADLCAVKRTILSPPEFSIKAIIDK